MALPPAQCCRVIHRRLRSPCDSSLLPESALSSAFEQLCSISRVTSRRNGSNVPGPLENRRRLGRRHMGELNFGHMNTPAPFWELAGAVDLTQWKWTAPTAFEDRHPQQERQDIQPFLASLQSWVARAIPSNSLSRDFDTPLSVGVAMEAVAPVDSSDSTRTIERMATPRLRQMPSETLNEIFEDVDEIMRQCVEAMFPTQSAAEPVNQKVALDIFCNRLQTAIANQSISRDVACIFLRRITREAHELVSTRDGSADLKKCDSLLMRVFTAVLDGLDDNAMVRSMHFDYYYRVYAVLLDKTARLNINTLRLFQRIMDRIPADSIWRCKSEIASNISTFLTALSQPAIQSPRLIDGKARHNLIRQINKMAACLRCISSEVSFHRDILGMVTRRLANGQEEGSDERRVSLVDHELARFAWLHLLARLPHVGSEYLGSTCKTLDSNMATRPILQRQICEFFLAKINNRYRVKGMKMLYELLHLAPEHKCYAVVSSKLWTSGQQRYIKTLADLLQHAGRQQDVKYIVEGLRDRVDIESKPLANLAIGMGHPHLALWVYIRYHQSRWQSKRFWKTAFAQETLDKLLESKEMRSEKILDALRIHPVRRRRRHQSFTKDITAPETIRLLPEQQARRQPRLSLRRVHQTERVASALSRAGHLSERMALTRITRCVQFLQSRKAPIPPQVLGAVFRILTKDLGAGRPGRTTRLRWYLQLLLKETDTSNVLEVGLALQKWRALLYPPKQR